MKPGAGIRTPLNYTGNKSRLVSQFRQHFPESSGTFVDLFCGGATIGLSVNATKVIFIDNNQHVIELLKHLAKQPAHVLIKRLEVLLQKYNLSYSAEKGYSVYRRGIDRSDNNGLKAYNSVGYYRLRDDFNALSDQFCQEGLDMLYLLVVYSFNNDMRFNRCQKFNLPVGKTDLNTSSIRRLNQYVERISQTNHQFICSDFRSDEVKKILLQADFIYADPPYLITRAVYNESGNWTAEVEKDFIGLLDLLKERNKKFAVSNVLNKEGAKNSLLEAWLFKRKDLHVHDIQQHYRSASYNKLNRAAAEREVLITSFK